MPLESLFFYKAGLAAVVVVLLSLLAEQVSPRWAGVLSGFPTGSAITLYFYGLQYGLEFAGHSAIFNMVGLVAMQMFLLAYYLCGAAAMKLKILAAVAGGLGAYLATIFLLSLFSFNTFWAVVIPLLSFIVFRFLFRKIPNVRIANRVRITWGLIALRAAIAAFIISSITAVAAAVGPAWAGLFSAFPATLLPLLLIIHWTYGEQFSYATIKHMPDGLGGLLAYSLVLHLSYPSLGLYSGIALAMGAALLYLVIYRLAYEWKAAK